MSYQNIARAKVIEQENKKRLLKLNPKLNDRSGIYFLLREDENGFKYAYIGQAVHTLSRLAMADYLNQNGYEDVAKDTRRLVEYIKSAKIRVETLFEMLSPVFKAVEWYCSADWGKDRVDKAIEEYRNGKGDSE